MKCIKCGTDSVGICQFCGRAICNEHLNTNLFITGYSAKSGSWSMSNNAVRVEDALWCGICHPEYKGTS